MSCSGCARRRAKLKALMERKKRAAMRDTFSVGSKTDKAKESKPK